MVVVGDFALGLVFDPVFGAVLSNDLLRRDAEMFEVQMHNDRLVPLLSSVSLECDTWPRLAFVQSIDIINR